MKEQAETPSWEDFCERLLKTAPTLRPNKKDEQWMNLYGVYQMGYESCLDRMKVLLLEEEKAG